MKLAEFKELEMGAKVIVTMPKALHEKRDRNTAFIFMGLDEEAAMYHMLYDDESENGVSFPASHVDELAKRTRRADNDGGEETMNDDKLAAVVKELTEILDGVGIEIAVGGCGCCGSPYFLLKKDGKVIVREEEFGFTNVRDKSGVGKLYV